MHWVPKGGVDECIFGVLESKKPFEHHEPPDRGGGETVSEIWQGAYVLLDPTHHDDGQKIAIENDMVGKPNSLLRKLVDAINAKVDRPYTIEFEPIFDSSSFWQFAESHNNVLKSITFDFVVPNMWGAKSSLDEDLKDTGQQTGAERVVVTLKGENGVFTENSKVKTGVEYAERGAGAVKARALDNTPYSSSSDSKTTEIPTAGEDEANILGYFKKLKGRILGHAKKPTDDDNDDPDGSTSSN